MGAALVGLIFVIALYIAFEIHKDRRRRGKRGIPFLGYIFDSVTVNVHEEILDECDGDVPSSAAATSKSGKKKKHHKHHKCSKKHKHRKSKNARLDPGADLIEDKTQRSEKSDRGKERKSSKDSKKEEMKPKDTVDVTFADLVPPPSVINKKNNDI